MSPPTPAAATPVPGTDQSDPDVAAVPEGIGWVNAAAQQKPNET